MFVFPPCGGFTFRILHASSSVKPEEEMLCIAVGLSFAAAAAYLEDADACLYASAKARPRTRVPVRTTCASIRCAWGVCQTLRWRQIRMIRGRISRQEHLP